MKSNALAAAILLAPLGLLLTVLPIFAASDVAPATNLSQPQTQLLIRQLDATRQADWNAALDPTVSPVRHGTFLNQMNKADRASKELSHGFAVSPKELADALWMPPKHITAQERAQLIQQLQQAKAQDDYNEQQMLNDLAWSNSIAPVDTVVFDQRKQQADGVIKNLEIGAPVHWSAIKQALVVPPSPY